MSEKSAPFLSPQEIAVACENSWNWLMHGINKGPMVSAHQLQEAARLLRLAFPEGTHCDIECMTLCKEQCQYQRRVAIKRNCEGMNMTADIGNKTEYFTVVYKGVRPGDEAILLTQHPKVCAMAWGNLVKEDMDRLERRQAEAVNE